LILKSLKNDLYKNRTQLSYNHEDSYDCIKKNYQVILDYFDKKLDTDKFLNYLLDNCSMVRVVVDDVAEAFQMFDSQNSRGMDLNPHDLLKAFHIRAMRGSYTELKIHVDQRWQKANNLSNVIGMHLYRIRSWTKTKKQIEYFGKKNVKEFKGYNYGENKYPFHHMLDHSYNYPSHFEGKCKRLNSTIDLMLNPYVSVNQKIINGGNFFDYIDTYSKLYQYIFDTPIDKSKDNFRVFYSENCLYPLAKRTGDTYVRNLYKSAIFALWDKFGEEIVLQYHIDVYIAVYRIRIENMRVEEKTVTNNSFAKDFFSILEHSYDPSEIRSFLNEINSKKFKLNPPKKMEPNIINIIKIKYTIQ